MKKTIGKNTVGGGEKMAFDTGGYSQSMHDLSHVWRNTQAVGTLIPFMKEVALPGDEFNIDLNAHVLTLPTIAPLFGSFKLQLDVFEVPMRLYMSALHNNKLEVGLNIG